MPNIFKQGDWAESFLQGMKLAQMRDEMGQKMEQLKQNHAEHKLRMEELKLRMEDQIKKREEADKLSASFQTDKGNLEPVIGKEATRLINTPQLYQKAVEAIISNAIKPEQMNEWTVLNEAAKGNPIALKIIDMKKNMTGAKPINMEVAYDTLGASYFPDYSTNIESQKAWNEKFQSLMSTPEGRKELMERRQSITPPSFSFQVTDQGIVPTITRGPGAGTAQPPTGLKKPMSNEMVTTMQQIGTLKDTLKAMKDVYKPEYVGPIAGRYRSIKEQTVGIDDNQALFRSRVAQLQNSLIYLMSGKQINEAEYERLKRQLPDVNLPSNVFNARMQEFERTVDSIIENRQKNMGAYVNNATGGNGGAIHSSLTAQEASTFSESQIIQRLQSDGFSLEQARTMAKDIISKRGNATTQPQQNSIQVGRFKVRVK